MIVTARHLTRARHARDARYDPRTRVRVRSATHRMFHGARARSTSRAAVMRPRAQRKI